MKFISNPKKTQKKFDCFFFLIKKYAVFLKFKKRKKFAAKNYFIFFLLEFCEEKKIATAFRQHAMCVQQGDNFI